MCDDAAAQQGRGTGWCAPVKTVLSIPTLAEIPALLNSCEILGLAVLRLFTQCIVLTLTIQRRFPPPVADPERYLCPSTSWSSGLLKQQLFYRLDQVQITWGRGRAIDNMYSSDCGVNNQQQLQLKLLGENHCIY